MAVGKLVQKSTLEMRTAQLRIFRSNLFPYGCLEGIEALRAERFGELLVDLDGGGFLHFLERNVKDDFLALEIFIRMIVRHVYLDFFFIGRLHADNLLFKAWQKTTLPQIELKLVHFATGEGLTIPNAGNIKGTLTTGATLGSQKLIDWVGKSERLSFRPVNHTHDPGTLRQIDNFVSINSALEIDLFGQINADVLGGSQVSGTGGSVDMMRGAALSNGGRSIIALNATASGGTVSRIVPALTSNTPATALRSDIDYVVTEFGAQRIKHLPVQARAEALIELAAPEFRHGLRTQWKTLTSV